MKIEIKTPPNKTPPTKLWVPNTSKGGLYFIAQVSVLDFRVFAFELPSLPWFANRLSENETFSRFEDAEEYLVKVGCTPLPAGTQVTITV